MKAENRGQLQTPLINLTPLIPYLRRNWTLWECACGNGNMAHGLAKYGFNIIATDILSGYDFFTWKPEKHWDCIVTCPPFLMKDKFFARAYELKRPFAFLYPLSCLETRYRQTLFRQYGIQIILYDEPVDYMDPATGALAWRTWAAWFTWGLGLRQQLTFVNLPRKEKK